MTDVTRLLEAVHRGDKQAAADRNFWCVPPTDFA